MRPWRDLTAVVVATAVLWSGTVLAQTTLASCAPTQVPSKVERQVVKDNVEKGKMTVRAGDGTTHEFQASKETLQDLKAGDRIEAKLRNAPNCFLL